VAVVSAQLKIEDVHLRFGGVVALAGVSIDVQSGEIAAIIGPNGAGKTSLLNAISGLYRPQRGSIDFENVSILGRKPHHVAQLGIARTFQLSSEFARLTVLENLMVPPLHQRGDSVWAALVGPQVWMREERAHLTEAWALLERFNLAPLAQEYAGNLSGGQKRLLELARALARLVECELITFGKSPHVEHEPSGLRIRTLAAIAWLGGHPAHPFAPGLPAALSGAQVVHTHHMRSLPSRIAVLRGRFTRAPVAVTDHGLQGTSWGGLLPRLFDLFLTDTLISALPSHQNGPPPTCAR